MVLTDGQLERLCGLAYLDDFFKQKEALLGDALYGLWQAEWPAAMTEGEWQDLIACVASDSTLRNLQILDFEDVLETTAEVKAGHRALLFAAQNVGVIVFRGTGSAEEWEDNGRGMFESDTVQQQAAARFVLEVRKTYPNLSEIIVAGHSKGGNKAQYVTLTLPEGTVKRCFSLDGQGFSAAFWHKYADTIQRRHALLTLAAERRGFVNALGYPLKESLFLTGRRGNARKGHPHGDPLPLFHCPDALRAADGALGAESKTALIPAVAGRWGRHFLESPQFQKKREATVLSLMRLMGHNAHTEDAIEAAGELLLCFADLLAQDAAFRSLVKATIEQEHDVLSATLHIFHLPQTQRWKKLWVAAASYLQKDKHKKERFVRMLGYVTGFIRHWVAYRLHRRADMLLHAWEKLLGYSR